MKTEHKAVLDTMRELERQGFEVTYLDVQENGLLDLDKFKDALRKDTILVSVMLVNNEIGVIQDIPAIGAMCRERGIIFHVDAAQATGKVAIDIDHAAGRPDEPGLAQDLRPQGHRRAVRAAQAARAHRGADARRRPRARHAQRARCPRTSAWAWATAFAIAKAEMGTEIERIRMLQQAPARRHLQASSRSSSTATSSAACRTT